MKYKQCKGCQWYNKPYWSIINPCDNCNREKTNIEIITRWQDPTIEEKDKEIERLNNIIKDIETYIYLWNIEEIGEKTMLILNDILLIKNGMRNEVVRLKDSDKECSKNL